MANLWVDESSGENTRGGGGRRRTIEEGGSEKWRKSLSVKHARCLMPPSKGWHQTGTAQTPLDTHGAHCLENQIHDDGDEHDNDEYI